MSRVESLSLKPAGEKVSSRLMIVIIIIFKNADTIENCWPYHFGEFE